VVRLLLERGADPTIATRWGSTPLMIASFGGHLEVVRLLLGHPSAKATINHRDGWAGRRCGGPATWAVGGS
jgi:ankyrin repeat protein